VAARHTARTREDDVVAGTGGPQTQGLRERKKAKTRQQIQEHALRLFRLQGYRETTVEQIAEAAEVSPSTVFHYFPTKADLVLYDALDERLIEAFRAVAPEVGPIAAMRQAMRVGFGEASPEQIAVQRERARLIRSSPELSSAMLEDFARTIGMMAQLLAERIGRQRSDDQVLALAGAILGVGVAVWYAGEGDGSLDTFLERFERGLGLLESGFSV
jgi:AcrR family transcriptional regulator